MGRLVGKLRDLRANMQIIRWAFAGAPNPPVPAVKRRLIHALLEKHGLDIFVETGTFKGDTLASVAATGRRAISVELSAEYFDRANARFAGMGNVELHHGDSGVVLPRIVATLTEPALFWLDGHYSAGLTALGDLASPISAEMQAILNSPVEGHVILIDDAMDFTGEGGYPELGRFLTSIAETGRFRTELRANIIIAEPIAS